MTTALALPEVVTLSEASHVLASLIEELEKHPVGGPVRLNAAGLRRFDSSALAVLLECRRMVLDTGREFGVDGLPAKLEGLAGVYGVAPLLAQVSQPRVDLR